MKGHVYQVAVYLRISRDDEDIDWSMKYESDSISSQRKLVMNYLDQNNNLELYDEYIDDGFTGSNFDRPDFQRMMTDISERKVNCIIVKDLSRFGRDYIGVGRYLQKIFPAKNIRFIAINDHYDSLLPDSADNFLILPVKNFINDSYCRDISVKVRSQLDAKRRKGEYVGAFTVFGYQKDLNNKNRLLVDRYASDVVKRIFNLKLEGMSSLAIARWLNENGFLSPMEYKKSRGLHYYCGFASSIGKGWTSVAVKRILTNEVYLGNLIQGCREKISYKIDRIKNRPREEWICVDQTHEAIISQSVFDMVQDLLKTDGRQTKENAIFHYSGLLFCGDCGEQMIRRVNRCSKADRISYICPTRNRGEGCTTHKIRESTLDDIVTKTLTLYMKAEIDTQSSYAKQMDEEEKESLVCAYYEQIQRMKAVNDQYHVLCRELQSDQQTGLMDELEYHRLYDIYSERVKYYTHCIRKQEEFLATLNHIRNNRSYSVTAINRALLVRFLRSIHIFENQRIQVTFRYRTYRPVEGGMDEKSSDICKNICRKQ